MAKRLAVLTSGGDSPGMNAAIRAVVRTGIHYGYEVFGVYNGLQGLIDNELRVFTSKDVANIIQRGGTILKTARSEEFRTSEGRKKAAENLKKNSIENIVIIGGDGSFKGAEILSQEYDFRVIGIPGTIDNDIKGTHYTIGFDTAVNTAINAIDKIRDTASSHNRVFVIEVMGRNSGLIALQSGVSCGAEDILIPESVHDFKQLMENLEYDKRRKKHMRIIVVCEGDDIGGAIQVSDLIKKFYPNLEVRPTILGHIQRGGSPTHYDRWIASRMGYEAVNAIVNGENRKFTALLHGKLEMVEFNNDIDSNCISQEYMIMSNILSR